MSQIEYKLNTQNEECHICYENDKNTRVVLECKHELCGECFSHILTTKKCPFCRQQITIQQPRPEVLNIDSTHGSGIYMYSFELRPEDYQPSGSVNFSRIDDGRLNLTIE